ncbi:MAG: cellulase family glycosylhydrolase [Thermoleophilaceae bacterium]|nr:cellulase family glycosylhydrolase [Thermoleophilaceae bacterium]
MSDSEKTTVHARRRLAAAAALLASIALLTSAGSAHAARGMEVAVQDDPVFVYRSYYDFDKALDKAAALGATRIRANVIWSRIVDGGGARTRPRTLTYNWAGYDYLIDRAAARGISVELTLTGPAPRWATANHRVGNYKPNARQFATFARDAAKHFRGRVDRYAIWNEPNWKSWLNPLGSAPRLYRALYTSGYRAIKAVDPRAKVLIGETAPRKRGRSSIAPLAFLRALTCTNRQYRRVRRCATLRADGYAHHPYAYEVSPGTRTGGPDDVTIATLPRLTSALARLRANRALITPPGASLYLTEYGYLTRGRFAFSTRRQAAYLKAAFRMAQRNRYVKQMLAYMLVSPPGSPNWDTGLITLDGKPRATYNALRAWTRSAAAHRLIARPVPFTPPPAPAG